MMVFFVLNVNVNILVKNLKTSWRGKIILMTLEMFNIASHVLYYIWVRVYKI